MKHIYVLLFLSLTRLSAQENKYNFDYFGQEPPDTIAKEFVIPTFINHNFNFIGSINFSPSGKMIVFGVTDSVWSTSSIVFTKNENGRWTCLDTLNSCRTGINSNPTFLTDSEIYFTSLRSGQKDLDILKTTLNSNNWSNAILIRELSIDTCREFMGNFSRTGELYFARLEKLKRPDKEAIMNNEIYSANIVNGKISNARNIGKPINTKYSEVSPFIGPKGRFLLFGSRRENGCGLVDTYISFRDEKGNWKEPKNIKEINTAEFDCDAIVTPDGKYLFFIRRQDFVCKIPNRIYWVSAKILEKYND